MLITMCNV